MMSRSRTSPSSGGSRSDYRHRFPEPADVALLVEVSESTLSGDRGRKLAAYARGGIPVYWIINLVDRPGRSVLRPGRRQLS